MWNNVKDLVYGQQRLSFQLGLFEILREKRRGSGTTGTTVKTVKSWEEGEHGGRWEAKGHTCHS